MGSPYPGKWTFKYHPWTREMHDSTAQLNVGMKSAQAGYTETLLNITFYRIDVLKHTVLYILPHESPNASNFSKSRFDPALEMSPHIAGMFQDVDNVNHKRAGSASLFVRGSTSRAGLKSDPCPVVVIDEMAEAAQENIPLALARLEGQRKEDRLAWMLSTPRFEKKDIHGYYLNTTQEHFFFKCPLCSRTTELIFPDCLVTLGEDENDIKVNDSYICCKECKGKLEHETKHIWLADGKWEATVPNRSKKDARGWYVNQLYSSVQEPSALAIKVHKAKKDPFIEQELWNSTMGLPHEVAGARITIAQHESAKGQYKNQTARPERIVTLGCDVGSFLHVEVSDYDPSDCNPNSDVNVKARAKTLALIKLSEFEELDEIMLDYRIKMCVIDANPERRKSHEFAQRFFGRVYCCFYGNNVRGRLITLDDENQTVTIDRTSWMDMALSRFKHGTIQIPFDAGEEHKEHITNLVKAYRIDKNNNQVASFEALGQDHFGHSRLYNELAFKLAFSIGKSSDIVRKVL